MKRSAKILLSLLIAIVLAGGFTFLAFTTLFTLVETGVYAPNLKAAAEKEVRAFGIQISDFLNATVGRCQAAVNTDVMKRALSAETHTASEIAGRREVMSKLFTDLPKLETVRFVDTKGDLIIYSTDERDITFRSATQITYGLLSKTDASLYALRSGDPEAKKSRLFWDGKAQRIIIDLPLTDANNRPLGAALIVLSVQAVENFLLTKPGLLYRNLFVLDNTGLLIDPTGMSDTSSLSAADLGIRETAAGPAQTSRSPTVSAHVLVLGNGRERFLLYVTGLNDNGSLGVLFPMRRFEMNWVDKIIALAVFYVSVFLLVFLLGNLKQDPIRIVAQRMHQFQVEFLREFFEKRDQINVGRWQKEIDTRREEIKRYMKRGIKKLTVTKETEIDSYIIDSWNEVVSIIKSKIQKPPEIDMARIETLLRKVLAEQHVIVSRSLRPSVGAHDVAAPPDTALASDAQTADVEEEAELLEEIESAEPMTSAIPIAPSPSSRTQDRAGSAREAEAEELEELIENAPEIEAEELLELEETASSVPSAPVHAPPTAQPGLIAKALHNQGLAGEEIELLSVVPEIKELPPLPVETLEELEPIAAENDGDLLASDLAVDFQKHINQGGIAVHSIADILSRLEPAGESIVLKDGIYRINDDLYQGAKSIRKHKGLRALAQSLLETKTGGISSIDELYASGELLGDSERKQLQERLSTQSKPAAGARKICFREQGIDLDDYMGTFAFQVTDKVMIYAIGELIKKAKAVSAVIFTDDGGLKVTIAIGLTNRSANLFSFTRGNFLYEQHLKKRKVIVCNGCFQQIKMFTKQLSSDDLKFIRSGLFLPAVLEKKDSYIFLGFTDINAILDINGFLKKLDIYPD